MKGARDFLIMYNKGVDINLGMNITQSKDLGLELFLHGLLRMRIDHTPFI